MAGLSRKTPIGTYRYERLFWGKTHQQGYPPYAETASHGPTVLIATTAMPSGLNYTFFGNSSELSP